MADDNIFNTPTSPTPESNVEQNVDKTEITEQNASVGTENENASQSSNISFQSPYVASNDYQQTSGTYYSYTPNSNNYRPQYSAAPQYTQPATPVPKKKKAGKAVLTVTIVFAIVTVISLFAYWVISEVSEIFGNKFGSQITSSQNGGANDNNALDNITTNSKPEGSDEYSVNSDGTMTAAAVIAKVKPSIVGIVQYRKTTNGIPSVSGEGSGIIISQDGYIITNAHVVEGASMVMVVLDDNKEYEATVKGSDTQSDLAVLKIDKTGLTAAQLGNSAQTVVGESVIAIGNPGGLELAGSCTGGMVSGLDRTIASDSTGYAMTYIQTDAAINPGNSGGALVNMYGQVIGINSAKIAADGYEGLGFAIPMNEALPIINDLQKYGYVKNRAKIGIGFQLISDAVSQYYNNTIPAGLLITAIDEDCDVARQNIEINDIVTKIDGKDIDSASVVYNVLQNKKPGDTVELTVYRMGTRLSTAKTFNITVKLAEDKGE